MFNFRHNTFSALKSQTKNSFSIFVQKVLSKNEELNQTFDGNDVVLFATNKRLIFLNLTSERKSSEDFFFVPYSIIRLYSASLSSHQSGKSSVHLQMPDMDVVTLEFTNSADAESLCKLLAQHTPNK